MTTNPTAPSAEAIARGVADLLESDAMTGNDESPTHYYVDVENVEYLVTTVLTAALPLLSVPEAPITPPSDPVNATMTTGWQSFEKMSRRQAIDTCYALESMRDRQIRRADAAHAQLTEVTAEAWEVGVSDGRTSGMLRTEPTNPYDGSIYPGPKNLRAARTPDDDAGGKS